MRENEAARRSSIFEDLFRERQVYLRSGLTSRYVVLSRPLLIAVTVGAGLVVLWLAVASYSSIRTHREAAEQRRELVRLERENQSLRAIAEVAPRAEGSAALEARVPELRASLAEVTAARERLAQQAAAASAEVAELERDLERELALAEERIAELDAARRLTSTDATAAEGDGDQPPEQLTEAEAEVVELNQVLAEARASEDELTAQLAAAQSTAERRIEELTAQLAEAQSAAAQRNEELTAQLAEAQTGAEQRIQELTAEHAAAQTGAERRIAGLTAQLAEAQTGAEQRIQELGAQLATSQAETQRLQDDLQAALENAAALRRTADTAEADRAGLRDEIAHRRERLPAEGDVDQELAQIKQSATAAPDEVARLKARLVAAAARIEALNADVASPGRPAGSAPLARRPALKPSRVAH